jgi:hypothetical protein
MEKASDIFQMYPFASKQILNTIVIKLIYISLSIIFTGNSIIYYFFIFWYNIKRW